MRFGRGRKGGHVQAPRMYINEGTSYESYGIHPLDLENRDSSMTQDIKYFMVECPWGLTRDTIY